MMDAEIIRPVVALVGWTLVMWVWMYATRLPAMMKMKDLDMAGMVGTTGRTLDDILPPSVQWKAHNYNHLHEQPTLFYAVALVLALLGAGNGATALLAWAYVGLRVVHSLVQVSSNKVAVRFSVFLLASLCLIALWARAFMLAFGF
jgi:hypothetical protein